MRSDSPNIQSNSFFRGKVIMKKKSLVGSLAGFVLVLPLLAGCDQTTEPIESAPAGVTNEVDAMKYFATTDEFVVNAEATFDDGEIAPVEFGTFGKIYADMTPLRCKQISIAIRQAVLILYFQIKLCQIQK